MRRLLGVAGLLASLALLPAPPTETLAQPCTPDVAVSVEPGGHESGEIALIDVSLEGRSRDGAPRNRISRVQVVSARNAIVEIAGIPQTVPFTYIPDPPEDTWRFTVRRSSPGGDFLVDFRVSDSCGTVSKFVGAGPAPRRPSPTALPSAPGAPTPLLELTATPTRTPTRTATPTASASPTSTPPGAAPSRNLGVSIAGAEFGEQHLPGTRNVDYLYAADAWRHQYLVSRGQRLIRVPFRWERVQREALAPLWPDDIAGLRAMLDQTAAAGQKAILDMHNYARYYEAPLMRADAERLADVWRKLARELGGHPGLYGYELMNEPHDLPEGSAAWAQLAQATVNAIRGEDDRAWILVPGYSWQGAWTWPDQNPSLDINDPANRLIYAAHQYFDRDGSGRYQASFDHDGAYLNIGVDRLQPFLGWLRQRNARGILTEFGVPDTDSRWLEVLDRFLAVATTDPNLAGGTYWSAGPWWGTYPLSVEPRGGQDRPQMTVLARYGEVVPARAAQASPTVTATPVPMQVGE